MAYKVYVKKLSSYEKKQKQARRERRQAKQLPKLTKDQIDEMLQFASNRLYARMREAVKADYPDLLPLMGDEMSIMVMKNFFDAGRKDALIGVLGQCEEEIEEFASVAMLGMATGALKGTNE